MLRATTQEAAEIFKVTPKTINEWVHDGLPVHRAGKQGAGNSHVIDMARAPEWVRQHQSRGLSPIAQYLLSPESPHPNPLRWVVERFFEEAVDALAAAAINWYQQPRKNGRLHWKEIGLTDEQARAMVFHQ